MVKPILADPRLKTSKALIAKAEFTEWYFPQLKAGGA